MKMMTMTIMTTIVISTPTMMIMMTMTMMTILTTTMMMTAAMIMITYPQNGYRGDIAIGRSSGYHHHHNVGDYDCVEDIDGDDYDFDDTVDDHDDPGVTLVSENGNQFIHLFAKFSDIFKLYVQTLQIWTKSKTL